jgi:hypothetical protein
LVIQGAEQAHHIVAWGDRRAKKVICIMKKYGIGPHDVENTVGLPKKFHERMHTKEYYERLEAMAETWTSRQDIIDDLDDLATELMKLSGKIK